ncbi:cytochrome c biogenesis CcdA family protein [Terrihalobacillus insolitus]|uniref:cytochrome c biogenesis CcdA family protein n=1 Tax=Terrihalobacillus insolitus TaxID=2950438 RepID=UPI002340B99D|nr:cytochrome c biogenesis protein CcdA [Terrihalobacillus insolitus]MDC3412947.1 cytochrome c biogenesis protein CcdA [Terrihalobacillus insolitus]
MEFIYEGLAGLESINFFVYFLVLMGGVLSAISICYIPILIMFGGYMGKHSNEGKGKALRITWSFVLGMIITSAIVGAVAAFIGKAIMNVFTAYGLDLWIPVIVGLLMGLQLLGVIKLKMPRLLAIKGKKPDTVLGAFTLGLPFGLVITPCTIPIFVMVITYVAAQGSVVHGALLLTVYTIGKGIVLTLVALGATTFLKDISKKWSGKLEKISGIIILLATLFLVIYQKFIY